MKSKVVSREQAFSLFLAVCLLAIGLGCLVRGIWIAVVSVAAGSYTDPYEFIPLFVIGVSLTGTSVLTLIEKWRDWVRWKYQSNLLPRMKKFFS
jgi:uncharacterized membrane protein